MVKKSVPEPPFIHTICTVYEANIYLTSLDINKNVTLAYVKQHLKIVLEIIKSRSTTLNIKMTRNYQNFFGKSKNTMDHQKLRGKISEYVVLTIQIVSAAFYV